MYSKIILNIHKQLIIIVSSYSFNFSILPDWNGCKKAISNFIIFYHSIVISVYVCNCDAVKECYQIMIPLVDTYVPSLFTTIEFKNKNKTNRIDKTRPRGLQWW